MPLAPNAVVQWVAKHVVPQEPDVRRWLRAKGVADADAEDLVQDAYCRIAGLASVSHIAHPDAYMFQTVRNLWIEQLRRQRIVPMTALTDEALSTVMDDAADPERTVIARLDLQRVEALIAQLPQRCRQIFSWKRIEGLSQKMIAQRLGVSEHVVENDVMKGLRLILAGLAQPDEQPRAATQYDGQGDDDADNRRERA